VTAPLFRQDGDLYTPTDLAHGPWARGFLHGGPVCGLAAHAAEQAQPQPDLRPARLVVDIHRAVPAEPLEVSSVCERSARRMALVNVTVRASGREVTRASALFLKPTDATPNPPTGRVISRLEGPAGLPTTPMIPPEAVDLVPPGFHRHVEVRWAPRDEMEPPAAWFRMPMPLLTESPTSPFVRAATLSDLGNAVAGLARRAAKQDSIAYINPDTTLYLHRVPQGEWLGLELDTAGEADGIGLSHIRLHDSEGPFGHTLSARLFNPITR
jgi:hypothetical protein